VRSVGVIDFGVVGIGHPACDLIPAWYPETIGQNSDLPTVTINNQWGRLKVSVQVGVWNGSAWEWGTFDTVSSYPTSNQYGYLANNSMCVGSVT
jgi:hypothetical protein